MLLGETCVLSIRLLSSLQPFNGTQTLLSVMSFKPAQVDLVPCIPLVVAELMRCRKCVQRPQLKVAILQISISEGHSAPARRRQSDRTTSSSLTAKPGFQCFQPDQHIHRQPFGREGISAYSTDKMALPSGRQRVLSIECTCPAYLQSLAMLLRLDQYHVAVFSQGLQMLLVRFVQCFSPSAQVSVLGRLYIKLLAPLGKTYFSGEPSVFREANVRFSPALRQGRGNRRSGRYAKITKYGGDIFAVSAREHS